MLFRQFQGAAAAALLVAAAVPAVAAETGSVTVHRGAKVSAVSFPSGGPVRVQRGAAVKTPAYAAPGAEAPLVLAGKRLWIVDRRGGRLTSCVLRRSIQVGRRDIRCTSRALSVPLLPRVD